MPSDHKRVDVLIVGAGAAGLAAARDLSQAGLHLAVIEARPRIGGRIFTRHDPHVPVPLELGAEFIHGEAPETLSIARAAGVAVVELSPARDIATSGRFIRTKEFWTGVDEMNRDLARRVAKRGRDFPVGEYLASAKLSALKRSLLQGFVEGFYAAHPDRLSAQSVAADADVEHDEGVEGHQFRIVNGYDALMRWLRDGLDPDLTEVRMSTVAQTVSWKRGDVAVECVGGDGAPLDVLRARTALITVPLALLRGGTPRFHPALATKQRALRGIETGQIFKIILRFRKAFWEDRSFLKERRGNGPGARAGMNFLYAPGVEVPTWWTQLPVRAPLLTGWVGGVAAETLLAEEQQSRVERSLVALSNVLAVPRRELEGNLDASATHDWCADPFARGAYSYIGVNGIGAPSALGRPVEDTLFFAGEATNGAEIGTVAGALASGKRAAREVVRVLQ